MVLSKKSLSISASMTLAVDAKAKKMKADGIDVIGFGAGEPDFPTPQHIIDAAIEALRKGVTKYTPASGTQELKKAICNKLKKDNNLDYTPNQIVISNGAKHSLFNIFQAILNPGNEVIIPSPYWVSYPELVKMADGIPVFIETAEKNGFKPDIQMIQNAITSNTRAIIINSPSNPTGAIYDAKFLEQLGQLAVSNDFYIISDEIYEKLIYTGQPYISVASLGNEIKEKTIIVNGMSKAYAMTGWRIGYTASDENIAKVMGNYQSHATSNPNSIAQYASIAALEGPEDSLYTMVHEFKKRRDYMIGRINHIANLSCIESEGAFYIMMNISKLFGKSIDDRKIMDSMSFTELLLEKEQTAVVPGIAFGNDNYVRLSYATSMDNIMRGLERIEHFVHCLI